MAQGKGSPALSGEVGHTRKEEYRGITAAGTPDILCECIYDYSSCIDTNRRQEPNEMVPKLFGPIRERYAARPGGYTRVLRIEPMKEDQAESAILELVDSPRDMRFALTAKTLAALPEKKQLSPKIAQDVHKVTRFRSDGIQQLRDMVETMRIEKEDGVDDRILPSPRKVYPEMKSMRDLHYYEDTDYYEVPNPVRNRAIDEKEVAPKELQERGERSVPQSA
jgi:large subunit ribosomal protein L17